MPEEPNLVKGQRVTLSLTAWGRLGEAMAEYQGQDVFVFGGIPGERVVAEVIRVYRRYASAKVVQVLEASSSRVDPPCPYYGDCTGCQWQHVDYQGQLAAKQHKVADALARVGGFSEAPVSEVIPSPDQYGYRNHARFTIGPQGTLGFVNRETRQFTRIDRCMLMHDGINQSLAGLQEKCGETTQLTIRAGKETEDTLIQPALSNPAIALATGQKSYRDSIDGKPFHVSSPSFFQVNVEQAAQLVQTVRSGLDLQGTDLLLDAYTGVGTFAVLLARYVRKVVAIEESTAAVANAKANVAGLSNIEFVVGKAEDVLSQLSEKPDAAILDPPRAGCHPRALESLIELAPPKIAYVSCDPESLGRDLKLLCAKAYSLEQVVPLDMFPQTHHVECVAFLKLCDPSPKLVLASASPRRRVLLSEIGLEFQITPADIPEEPLPGETAEELVRRLSLAKAQAVADGADGAYVIGADSVVVLDGRILGKPQDSGDARRMLRELRGTRHQVFTGVTVINSATTQRLTDSLASDITLRNFSDAEMEASIASGTPLDKAGAYAVQDQEFRPAESWRGCYSNIVGLPLCRLMAMLQQLGYVLPDGQTLPAPPECGNECPLVQEETP